MIGGKFLVCYFTFRWAGAFSNSIVAPDGCWCITFRDGGSGGRLGRSSGAGASQWVCLACIVAWDGGRECLVVGVKDNSADIWISLISPPPLFLPFFLVGLK